MYPFTVSVCVCCFFLSFDSTFSHKHLDTKFTVTFLQAYFQQNFRLKIGFYCAKWMWSLLKLWGKTHEVCWVYDYMTMEYEQFAKTRLRLHLSNSWLQPNLMLVHGIPYMVFLSTKWNYVPFIWHFYEYYLSNLFFFNLIVWNLCVAWKHCPLGNT